VGSALRGVGLGAWVGLGESELEAHHGDPEVAKGAARDVDTAWTVDVARAEVAQELLGREWPGRLADLQAVIREESLRHVGVEFLGRHCVQSCLLDGCEVPVDRGCQLVESLDGQDAQLPLESRFEHLQTQLHHGCSAEVGVRPADRDDRRAGGQRLEVGELIDARDETEVQLDLDSVVELVEVAFLDLGTDAERGTERAGDKLGIRATLHGEPLPVVAQAECLAHGVVRDLTGSCFSYFSVIRMSRTKSRTVNRHTFGMVNVNSLFNSLAIGRICLSKCFGGRNLNKT